MTLEPGQLLKWNGKDEVQVVWIGTLQILRHHFVEDLEAVCIFFIKKGKFKTFIREHDTFLYSEDYFYSKANIGKDGL